MRSAERLLWPSCVVLLAGALVPAQALSPVQRARYAMGTMFEITAYHPSRPAATRAVEDALAEVVRLDRVLSHYKADSDLSRLNRGGADGFVAVPAELFTVVEQALRFSRQSDGAFDITIGPLLRVWKAAYALGRTPSVREIEEARACVGYQAIEMAPPDRIRFRSRCTELDLGGIGKGYAVDRAWAVLASAGVDQALVSAGGSTIAAAGAPPGQEGWPVALAGGRTLLLRDAAIATSRQRLRRPPLSPGAFGEIIDPERATPVESLTTVTVVTPRATDADALSTTLLLVGPRAGEAVLANHPVVSALWMAAGGELQAGAGLARLRFADDTSHRLSQ